MGETFYYATFLTFQDVAEWIKPTDEVHNSVKLSQWIQRQLMERHANGIAKYLTTQNDRFFSAIVVGIYGGEPSWNPLDVSAPIGGEPITDEQREFLDSSFGLLTLKGNEKLFAIDGQHRVAGIKQAVKDAPNRVGGDEIIAIFVGHDTSKGGRTKTRRLFTTLNKTARRVSEADRVALDEDDGFAITTRRLIDESKHFADTDHIAFSGSAALPKTSSHITSIINLYHQSKDLYSPALSKTGLKRTEFANARPTDSELENYYKTCFDYWRILQVNVTELKNVFSDKTDASSLRQVKKNHLLLRPIGQRAFACAVGELVARGSTMNAAIKKLSKVEMWLHKKTWAGILWDPVQKTMLKSVPLAESYLLYLVKEPARSPARQQKLDDVLASR